MITDAKKGDMSMIVRGARQSCAELCLSVEKKEISYHIS